VWVGSWLPTHCNPILRCGHVYSPHAYVTASRCVMRRPSSARRDCQSKTRRRRRVARSACQRLGAQRLRRSRTLRRQWRLGRGVHGAHSHLPHFLAPPAQSREGGRRQGERWDACKRRTFFFTSGAGHAYHVGAGSAGQATSM